MKHTLSLLLAGILLASSFAACGESSSPDTPDVHTSESEVITNSEVMETELSDELPDVDYNGSTINVAIYGGSEQNFDMVTAGQENGDQLNDAVYRRNKAIEERFNIVFNVIETTDTNKLHNSVASGSDDYQILFYPICYGITLSNKGDFVSTDKLSYMDLDKKWWDNAISESLSVNNKLYFFAGDISPCSLGFTACVLFNKKLFDDSSMSYPYEDARIGKWTIDKIIDLTKGLNTDLNGDGVMSEFDDLYGYSCWMWDCPLSFFYGGGGKFVSKDENDIPYLDIDVEKISGIYNKMYDLLIKNDAYLAVNTGEAYNNTFQVFKEDRSYFIDTSLMKLSNYRDMNSDYGVLPIPKYDESQANYLHYANSASSMVSIPITIKDTDMISIIIEGMASESYKNLTPVFTEYVLKGKHSRDEQSSEMCEIIMRNRVYELAYIYSISGFNDLIRPQLMKKSENIASEIEKNTSKAQKSLDTLIEQMTSD